MKLLKSQGFEYSWFSLSKCRSCQNWIHYAFSFLLASCGLFCTKVVLFPVSQKDPPCLSASFYDMESYFLLIPQNLYLSLIQFFLTFQVHENAYLSEFHHCFSIPTNSSGQCVVSLIHFLAQVFSQIFLQGIRL